MLLDFLGGKKALRLLHFSFLLGVKFSRRFSEIKGTQIPQIFSLCIRAFVAKLKLFFLCALA
jgi:hypothetical protein